MKRYLVTDERGYHRIVRAKSSKAAAMTGWHPEIDDEERVVSVSRLFGSGYDRCFRLVTHRTHAKSADMVSHAARLELKEINIELTRRYQAAGRLMDLDNGKQHDNH